MSSLVDATAALSVTDERPDALAPAPPTCVPSDNSHSSPPGMAAARLTRRRFDAEPGVHIKLDKRGDGVAPVEGDTVQVNYSGRVKGKKTEFGMMRRPFIILRRRVDGVPVGVPTLLSSPSTRVMRR